jgi:hypothetical protein
VKRRRTKSRRTKSRRRSPAVTRRRAVQIKRLKVKLAWLRKEYRKVQAFIRAGRSRRNPKRDGSPTRGELRQGKYQEYLRQLAKAGQAAHAQLLRLQGRGGSANEPHPEPALKAPKTETQTAHPGHYAPAAAEGEPGEARIIRQGLEDMRVLRNDFMAQLKELGDSDENAAEAEAIQSELIDLAKKERKLKAKAAEVGLVMTNPGRRRRSNPGYYKRRRNSRSYYR